MHKCSVGRGLIVEGTVMADVEVRGAVIGLRSVIGAGTTINDSVLVGNDYYGTEKKWRQAYSSRYRPKLPYREGDYR